MYELYKIDEDLYQIHSDRKCDQAMEGTLLAILTYGSYALGINVNEMEFALLDMLEHNLDAAYFGVNRTFIFSFDRATKGSKKTG